MKYLIAEKFRSTQGEGVFVGTPMAFIRLVGCSVGKKICNACDTAFEKTHPWLGGGEFDEKELADWASYSFNHFCLTGGEPLDQDLQPLIEKLYWGMTHIETSGTKEIPKYLDPSPYSSTLWLCVSPKPGFREEVVERANEVKVIVPGLGSGEGWPTLEDALRWARLDRPVFLQPRNRHHEIDWENLHRVQELVQEYPNLRMSVQLHKLLSVR